jgi:hypothetical protein
MEPEEVNCPECGAAERQPCPGRTEPHSRRPREAKNRTALLEATGERTLRQALQARSIEDLMALAKVSRRWIIERRRDVGLKGDKYNRIRSAEDARREYRGIGVDTDEVVAKRAYKSAATIWRVRKKWGIPAAGPPRMSPGGMPAVDRSAPLDPHYLKKCKNPRRVLRILRERGPCSVREVRDALGGARNKVARDPLGSLAKKGWVQEDRDGRWSLGPELGDAQWAIVEEWADKDPPIL